MQLAKTMLTFLLLSSSAFSQIVIESEVSPYEPIIAAVASEGIPEGAEIKTTWSIGDGARFISVSPTSVHVWAKPGNYTVSATVVWMKFREIVIEGETLRVMEAWDVVQHSKPIRVLGSVDPKPPVPPDDDDEDEDEDEDPSDAPFETVGLTVLIIKEGKDVGSLPEAQKAIFTSSKIQKWCIDNCVKIDGEPAVRFWDDDYTDEQLANVPNVVRNAYRTVLSQANGNLPWIAISDGKTGVSMPLPGTVDETMELLQKYGG